ncbi:hypothetical protein TIFTF001_032941 [Ficus carica]|uniref:Legumain prodomain domain-containing protein n=1 Tax=Ficus carica TaxID=3494 RepID=A0AA88DY12_FICCA|nr:hypothetical protein TIFTF001_032941 [Ficus carica]
MSWDWDRYFILFLAISIRLWSLESSEAEVVSGTKWAVLIAGSNGYFNYRHQADVCHAYQILKKGGLKDENIIVFMYDDIAFEIENPRPGVIINKPDGPDVYQGVPKDYTGDNATSGNFYAVILGNRSALTGGSGKVLDSGPDDHIFIYYADHGSPGILGMPVDNDRVYAKDLVDVLKKKHEAKGYKSMVIYIEACESGSMFEGILPENISIYATTAANGNESSFGTYCPGDISSSEFDVCLGDTYSISWMEDCDKIDLSKETLGRQYEVVRRRTAYSVEADGRSHVMQYGNMDQKEDSVSSYLGSNPDNDNYTSIVNHDYHHDDQSHFSPSALQMHSTVVSQRDAHLLYFWRKFHKALTGSREKLEAQRQLNDEISRRKRIDYTMQQIAKFFFGTFEESSNLKTYEKYCGRLSRYGMKYTRAIANMCNAGITTDQLVASLIPTCPN